jgi:hypothetical protein
LCVQLHALVAGLLVTLVVHHFGDYGVQDGPEFRLAAKGCPQLFRFDNPASSGFSPASSRWVTDARSVGTAEVWSARRAIRFIA